MDNRIHPITGDYTGDMTAGVENAALIRLKTPLGTWPFAPHVGSKLHQLPQKDLDEARALAEQYAWQALEPLVQGGRATSVTVVATRRRPGWIDLSVSIRQANGDMVNFEHPVRVI